MDPEMLMKNDIENWNVNKSFSQVAYDNIVKSMSACIAINNEEVDGSNFFYKGRFFIRVQACNITVRGSCWRKCFFTCVSRAVILSY